MNTSEKSAQKDYQKWLMTQAGARQPFKKNCTCYWIELHKNMFSWWIAEESYPEFWESCGLLCWAPECLRPQQILLCHMQTLASLRYFDTEILLQTETEQPGDALLQLHQLRIFKSSEPLKAVFQLGLPVWKTNKKLANLMTQQKNAFSVY